MFGKKKKTEITELQKMEYEYHNKHRSYLVEQKHNMENKFSQLLIYLSAGIFTISIGLFKIYNFDNYICLILISWFLSLLSLIFILFSFIYSIKAYNTEIKYWDENKRSLIENYNTNTMKRLVKLGLTSLILSIILLFIFYFLNFINMSDGKNKTFVETQKVGVQKNSEPVQAGISPTEFISNNEGEKNN